MTIKTTAVLGAGRVGTAVARVLRDAGYDVAIAASGPASAIELIVDVTAPGVRAATAAEAVDGADLVVVSVPMRAYASLDPDLLAGHVVVDAMNHWVPTDGHVPALEQGEPTSVVVARHLARSRVAKTFNHLGYHELEQDRREPGDPERRALGVAADDAEVRAAVAEVVDRVGFDPVDVGPLAATTLLQGGGAAFGARLDRAELEALVTA